MYADTPLIRFRLDDDCFFFSSTHTFLDIIFVFLLYNIINCYDIMQNKKKKKTTSDIFLLDFVFFFFFIAFSLFFNPTKHTCARHAARVFFFFFYFSSSSSSSIFSFNLALNNTLTAALALSRRHHRIHSRFIKTLIIKKKK